MSKEKQSSKEALKNKLKSEKNINTEISAEEINKFQNDKGHVKGFEAKACNTGQQKDSEPDFYQDSNSVVDDTEVSQDSGLVTEERNSENGSQSSDSGNEKSGSNAEKSRRVSLKRAEEFLAKKGKITSPVVRSSFSTRSIMIDMIIALMPAIIASVYFFGYRVSVLLFICVGSSILFEFLWCKLQKKPNSVVDLSCIVSGIILTMTLPVTVPLWIPVVGSLFMIVFVKMCFGGLGQNFMNPAAAAKSFLVIIFPLYMSNFVAPSTELNLISNSDNISALTPLAALNSLDDIFTKLPSYLELYFGNVPGSLGETSAFAIIIGGIYLAYRRILNWEIPIVYFAAFSVLNLVSGNDVLYHLLSGGVIFGGIFMATDYTTSPVTQRGRIIYGVALAVSTYIIRNFGSYPEGVSFAIIFCNVLSSLIDSLCISRKA